MSVNWDSPESRLAFLERVGPQAYNQAFAEHRKASVLETVNGREVFPVDSARFGRLFGVSGSGSCFTTIEAARDEASKLGPKTG